MDTLVAGLGLILAGAGLLLHTEQIRRLQRRLRDLEAANRRHTSRLDAGASLWKDLERRVSDLDDPLGPHRKI